MAGTFSQIHIQAVFAVKYRENLLQKPWREELFKYISGIITNKGQKSIIVNGVGDHVHVFFGLKPSLSVSDLLRDIKNNSSGFINDNKFLPGKFSWQEGFGAFSYSKSHVERVYNYILNQEEHHRKKTFREEYMEMLDLHGIPYEERFLFDWMGK
ncbi:MAG: IS200/IS605 family transposase [Bacteroidota bacterium]